MQCSTVAVTIVIWHSRLSSASVHGGNYPVLVKLPYIPLTFPDVYNIPATVHR